MPINLHTINQFYGKTLNPEEAREFVEGLSDKSIGEPRNFEEQAMKFIGKDLYKAFFYGYTKKQWGCEPAELPASILKRLPVRFNYNDNYYNNPIQGIPVDGYTSIFEKLLEHKNIEVRLSTKFDSSFDVTGYDHGFFTQAPSMLSLNTGTAGFHTAQCFSKSMLQTEITRVTR
jgi:UDP-galactopyranose mutase